MNYYDDTHNRRPRNVFAAHLAMPFKRACDHLRGRIDDLSNELASPAMLDQHPGQRRNFIITRRFGPFDLVTARREGAVGHEGRSALVNLGDFLEPAQGPVRINREGAFYWTRTSLSGFVSLTYDADPGFIGAPAPVINPLPVGGLFDSVLRANGGAICLNDFFSHPLGATDRWSARPNISFDLQLYDRKRGRRIHEDWIPPQVFSGQGFANKETAYDVCFDVDTEIDVRLRLLEVRMANLLDTDQAFDAAQFAGYVYLTMMGYKVLA